MHALKRSVTLFSRQEMVCKAIIGAFSHVSAERGLRVASSLFSANKPGKLSTVWDKPQRDPKSFGVPHCTGEIEKKCGTQSISRPLAKWKGKYPNSVRWYGPTFSPIVITEIGELFVGGVQVESFSYDEGTNKLSFTNVMIKGNKATAELSFFNNATGQQSFKGRIIPSPPNGWIDLWKSATDTSAPIAINLPIPDYFRVTPQLLSSNPYASTVLLEQHRDHDPTIYYGTGVVASVTVGTFTKTFILTCAHNIKHPGYGGVQSIRVYPACNTPISTGSPAYFDVLSTDMRVPSAWGQARSQYRNEDDYGILIAPVPVTTPPLKLAFCEVNNIQSWAGQGFVQAGYPLGSAYEPVGQMWTQAGTIAGVYNTDLLYYNPGVAAGNSGASIVAYDKGNPYGMAILIGADTQTGVTGVLPLTRPINDAIQSWLK